MPADTTQSTEVVQPAVAAPDGAAAPVAQPQATPAESTTPVETQGAEAPPKTPLEAAKRVMAQATKPVAAKPQDGETQPPKTEVKVEDDDATLPPEVKNHPRYKKLASENRILNVAKEKNETAIKELEPKARTFDDLTGYLQSQNLEKDDFATGLTIMAAVRNDPFKAYELLQPVMAQLEGIVGVRLPADLQAMVNQGKIDPETAQQFARTRGSEAVLKSRVETTEQRMKRENDDRAARENARQEEGQLNTVVSSLNSLDEQWAKRDPDAAKLRPLLEKIVLVKGGENPPTNEEEARKLWDESLAEAKRISGAWTPPLQSKVGVLPVGGQSASNSAPVPKSSLDAARAALTLGR